jgi:Tol biopolymer transport system component
MRSILLMAAIGVLAPVLGLAQTKVPDSGDWHGISPDGKHLAALGEQPDDQMIWRKDIDTGLLEIVDASSITRRINSDFDTAQYGKYVCFNFGDRSGWFVQWSPDSRYLVMTTASNGGHSPWHADSFVYSVQDRTLRAMDDVIGLVVSRAFEFIGPHTVRMKIDPPEGDFEHPKSVTVDLDQKISSMPKIEVMKQGDLSR